MKREDLTFNITLHKYTTLFLAITAVLYAVLAIRLPQFNWPVYILIQLAAATAAYYLVPWVLHHRVSGRTAEWFGTITVSYWIIMILIALLSILLAWFFDLDFEFRFLKGVDEDYGYKYMNMLYIQGWFIAMSIDRYRSLKHCLEEFDSKHHI